MVKLLLEKDEEIKSKDNLILNLESQATSQIGSNSMTENAIIDQLKSEISKKDIIVQNLERKTIELSNEVERLNEELKSKSADVVVQASAPEQKLIKPMPPEISTIPLESLCQDLQSDLTKYKRIVENLKKEKNELKNALEGKDISLTDSEFEPLEKENELLKKKLAELQNSLSSGKKEAPTISSEEYGKKIQNLENKVREKETIIADLKLSTISPTSDPSSSMAELVENLQKNINKLKITLSEKEKEITDLKVNLL
jgi:predicted RNase H-like nuclease (RuvC/YqgF family)